MATTEEAIDMETGEVLELSDSGTIMAQTKSEINQQIQTAHEYTRSIERFRQEAFTLATQDPQAAADCVYALPRGKEKNADGVWEKKIIKGPSARFAEIIAYSWGNCRYGARVVSESPTHVVAQGMFHDLERNMAISYEVRRRIVDKDGNRFSPDMVGVTANAACSIALRNAVLKAIPQALWKGIFASAEKVITGDIKTLVDRRKAIFDLFKPFGMTIPMCCQLVGAGGPSEVAGEHLVMLQGMLTALRDGDVTVESLLSDSQDHGVASKGEQTLASIKNKYKPEIAASEAAKPAVQDAAKLAQQRLDAKRKQAPVAPLSAQQIGFEGAPTNLDAEPAPDKEPF